MWWIAIDGLLWIFVGLLFIDLVSSEGVLPSLEARATTVPAPIVIPASQDW